MGIADKQKEKLLDLAGKGKLSGRDAFHVIFLDYLERTYRGKGLLGKREIRSIQKGVMDHEEEVVIYNAFAGATTDIMLAVREAQVYGMTCLLHLERGRACGQTKGVPEIKSNYASFLGTKTVLDDLTRIIGIPFREVEEVGKALETAFRGYGSSLAKNQRKGTQKLNLTKSKPTKRIVGLVRERLSRHLGEEWWTYAPYPGLEAIAK